jgi:NADH dehydrogenase
MKTKEELIREIHETKTKIHENYPELSKFENEMIIIHPSDVKPENTISELNKFNDSLKEIEKRNDKSKTNHIVIIGAGFAGLKIARVLNNHPNYTITLIDKNNYHQFQPLFYQVAMANLDASNISFPLRTIFEKSKNVRIRVSTVTNINTKTKLVETLNGNLQYDYLVIATGAVTNYFGNSVLEKNVFSMKSTYEALQIRNTLVQHFEDALAASNSKTKIVLSVVIVGGGPTGVELRGRA